ncbi:MAG: serine/threonine protein kinase [Gammaproteobacteria bacterium]|nr:serine/threonine protein kinase [Gammaproteobacteria bacterium]
MMEPTPGLELGARFVLIRQLGSGGTSEVWLANDATRGEPVALKIFFQADPGLAARLAAELAGVRSLGVEHAVPIHDVLRVEDCSLVVMEYQQGGDLGQFRGRSFESWKQAADNVIGALAAAHAQNLIHRDLKCSNVLLDATGRARLADFSLAALAGGPAPPGGSPYNASPQQLRGAPATPADDLYALGAMFYELIAGHPPYYPEITRERVLFEPVPPLLPRGTVPVGVRELALRLLAKSPQERPASLPELRKRLMASDEDEIGMVEAHALGATPAPASSPGRRWLPAVYLAAAAAVAAIFIWLPKYLATHDTGIVQVARDDAEAKSRERKAAEQKSADTATQKAAAEKARAGFDEAFAALDAHSAASWATDGFAAARVAGGQAAQSFAVGNYAAAQQAWEAAAAKLAGLEKERPGALQKALDRGKTALAQGKTTEARAAFESALAIEPGHAAARAGIERAARLDQAFTFVDAAVAQERTGRLAEAEQGFRKALALDAAAPGATDGLARLAARKSDDAFAAAMSRGLADLTAGRTGPARASFQQALALRPDSREVRDALASLDQGQRVSALQLLEARAASAESDERWDEALVAWREAAGLEPGLASAREGIVRSQSRVELQQRIDALMQHQERLWDPTGRGEARTVLAMAAATGNPRQHLATAASDLERLALAAEKPVRLRLESDGLTSIAIYRIGQYGTFSQRDVELLPGRYTVVGTRTGFRDVRREVILMPGSAPPAVVVKCEETI